MKMRWKELRENNQYWRQTKKIQHVSNMHSWGKCQSKGENMKNYNSRKLFWIKNEISLTIIWKSTLCTYKYQPRTINRKVLFSVNPKNKVFGYLGKNSK